MENIIALIAVLALTGGVFAGLIALAAVALMVAAWKRENEGGGADDDR